MTDLEAQILKLGERRKLDELQALINKTPATRLISVIEKLIGRSKCAGFWNYLLLGFSNNDKAKDKRFSCVKAVLKQLSSVELTYKQTYDLITRLFLDLPSFSPEELIEIVEYSIDCLKMGDPKCVGWKDLLPETINILANIQNLTVNGINMTGSEFKANTVRNLCTMKWPPTVLTAVAHMFREMKLTNEQIGEILTKFCKLFQNIEPMELAPLTFQLFSMCNSAPQIVKLIIALQKYFYKHHYKKLFADMESDTTDFNSIDAYSDKELREAEETVLHHLNYCTQFKISETQICVVIRNLMAAPDVILTPFVMSAILTMTRTNRDPDARLSSSITLIFLRSIIRNNEDEKELSKSSAWCRDTFQSPQVDLEKIFTVLIDQNNDGKDVVTPALVNLSFVLLKAKNSPKLNALGMFFLQKFIKKRFIFGQGVVQKLAEWMIIDQEDNQYAECLTKLSMTDTFTISECVKTIKYVLDFFLWIPGHHAMRMMSFIFPIIKISHTIRDEFIDVLKKAIYSKDSQRCQMGVYGFCMILKQLNNNNSQRGTIGNGNIFTQQSISGFSLMSQATLGNRNNPQRFFNMLTLEIIGLLRNCFRQSLEIKETLYENLIRAVELNPKLIPHILQFIDWHFRAYFDISETNFEIHFTKLIRILNDDKEIEITDNLGRLINLVSCCVILSEKHELEYDASLMRILLNTLTEKITRIDFEELGLTGTLNHKTNLIATQYLCTVQSLISYLLWRSKKSNSNVEIILKLFKHHRKIVDEIKRLLGNQNKRMNKKGKTNDPEDSTQNVTVNGTIVKRVTFIQDNVWDLLTFERFLRLLHDDYVSFATEESAAPLRSNRELVRYVTTMCSKYIENIRLEPEYKQISHSRRILNNLIETARLVYEKCIKKLKNLWTNFDVTTAYLSVECFRQILLTVDAVFHKKYNDFLKGIDFHFESNDQEHKKVTTILQEIIDKCMEEIDPDDEVEEEEDFKKISVVLFQCLEILYSFISHDDRITVEAYKWLFNFCQKYELKRKELGIVHKLLFEQRQKTHSGQFYNTIAMHLEKLLGQIDEEVKLDQQFEFKSITLHTSDSCLTYMVNIIRKQVEDIEHFIMKAKSLHTKVKITSDDDQEISIQSLKAIERSICSQLIHITNALLHLTNACIPLGTTMDNLVRVLMQTYICITNFTKHLILRNSTISISFPAIRFDQLLKTTGKPLATRIYSLISYIEANILEDSSRKKNHDPKTEKAKILRETKFLPKLILRVENFNKFVIMLSKKTNSHLTHYLHMGTVRYFSIKTSALKTAIDETLTRSSQIEVNESMLEENEESDNDDNMSTHMTNDPHTDADTPVNDQESEIVIPPSGAGDLGQESRTDSMEQVLKNLAKVNEKSKKRKVSKGAQDKVAPVDPVEAVTKKARKSTRKK